MRTFKQLTQTDRVYISRLRANGLVSVTQIAQRLGVHKSTISRELKRNAQVVTRETQLFYQELRLLGFPKKEMEKQLDELKRTAKDYRNWVATEAQRTRDYRLHCANQVRRRKSQTTRKWVIQKLKMHWSPAQIAGRSKVDGPEPISHEYVYQLIIADRKSGGNLYRLLKRFRKRKQRIAQRVYGPIIPNRTSIESRPTEANCRERLGDLEADLVQGYCSDGYVLSVIDRKSRILKLRKIRRKQKGIVRKELEYAIRKMGVVHTLTSDNGSEFCDHQQLTKNTGVPVYFTHPYSSCERGSIENANGLIRYFLPKKTPFKKITQTHLNKIETLLNNRPRKCLGFLTPIEVHSNQTSRVPEGTKTSHNRCI